MEALKKPRIEAFVGTTGSGKGLSIWKLLETEKPQRIIIWDPRNEYGKLAPAYDQFSYLIGAIKHAKGGPIRARFVAGADVDPKEAFALLCKIVFATGDVWFLAEELSDVTTASYAPPAWKKIITQGRHQRLVVLGAVQRPALVDKNFLGNVTYVRCFALRYDDDCKAMAKLLRVTVEQVSALTTVESETATMEVTTIQYIERRFRGNEAAQAGSFTARRKKGAT